MKTNTARIAFFCNNSHAIPLFLYKKNTTDRIEHHSEEKSLLQIFAKIYFNFLHHRVGWPEVALLSPSLPMESLMLLLLLPLSDGDRGSSGSCSSSSSSGSSSKGSKGCQKFWPLVVFKCCGLWPQQTVVAGGCKYPLCDFKNVVDFGHNDLWWPLAANGQFGIAVYSSYSLILDTKNRSRIRNFQGDTE